MRKCIQAAWRWAVALLCVFALAHAMPVYAQSGEVSVRTVVPETHTIVIPSSGGGSSIGASGKRHTVQGEAADTVRVKKRFPWLEALKWRVFFKYWSETYQAVTSPDGYAVGGVPYNQMDATAELTEKNDTVFQINDDGTAEAVRLANGQESSDTEDSMSGVEDSKSEANDNTLDIGNRATELGERASAVGNGASKVEDSTSALDNSVSKADDDTADVQQSGSNSQKTENVRTGDVTHMYVWMTVLLIVLFVLVVIASRIRKEKKRL